MASLAIISQVDFDDDNQKSWATGAMMAAVIRAAKKGYNEFMIRCAPGIEMYLAQVVLDTPCADLVVVHPYEGFGYLWKRWRSSDLEALSKLESEATRKIYVDEVMYKNGKRSSWDRGSHSMDKYLVCCEWMTDTADASLIASDGRSYGTAAATLAHATLFAGKPVYWVNPKKKEADWLMP